jgi:hypothetical protein
MKYDCGTTRSAPHLDTIFRALYRGWRGVPEHIIKDELLVLGMTRGIPQEWLYAVFQWTPVWRTRFKRILLDADHARYLDHASENEASVVPGDGIRMIRLAGPHYAGAAPLWTQLDLQNQLRSDETIAAELGVNRQKVRRWRLNPVFDPVTGSRIRPNRGSSIALPAREI